MKKIFIAGLGLLALAACASGPRVNKAALATASGNLVAVLVSVNVHSDAPGAAGYDRQASVSAYQAMESEIKAWPEHPSLKPVGYNATQGLRKVADENIESANAAQYFGAVSQGLTLMIETEGAYSNSSSAPVNVGIGFAIGPLSIGTGSGGAPRAWAATRWCLINGQSQVLACGSFEDATEPTRPGPWAMRVRRARQEALSILNK